MNFILKAIVHFLLLIIVPQDVSIYAPDGQFFPAVPRVEVLEHRDLRLLTLAEDVAPELAHKRVAAVESEHRKVAHVQALFSTPLLVGFHLIRFHGLEAYGAKRLGPGFQNSIAPRDQLSQLPHVVVLDGLDLFGREQGQLSEDTQVPILALDQLLEPRSLAIVGFQGFLLAEFGLQELRLKHFFKSFHFRVSILICCLINHCLRFFLLKICFR